MIHRNSNIAVAVAVVLVLSFASLGCNPSPTAPRQANYETELGEVNGFAKGGNGKGGSGSGAVLVDLTLAGGMIGGPEAVPVQNDNKRELNVQGTMHNVSISIVTVAGSCEMMQGDPTRQGELEGLFETPLIPKVFRAVMIFDKNKNGQASDNHRLTLNWDQPAGSYIVNVTEGVMAQQSGNVYTYTGGYVRAQAKESRQTTAILRCLNDSTITATVEDNS